MEHADCWNNKLIVLVKGVEQILMAFWQRSWNCPYSPCQRCLSWCVCVCVCVCKRERRGGNDNKWENKSCCLLLAVHKTHSTSLPSPPHSAEV